MEGRGMMNRRFEAIGQQQDSTQPSFKCKISHAGRIRKRENGMKSGFFTSSIRVRVLLPLGCLLLFGTSACSPSTTLPEAHLTQNSATQAKNVIKVGGSSSTTNLLKVLSADYKTHAPDTEVQILDPGQSENTIAGVKQKIINIAAIAKKPSPEENDGTLNFQELALDGILVATHSTVTGITNLTTEQLKGIYSGQIDNWKDLGGPDAPIVLLDRPEDESAKRLLRKHYLGPDLKNTSTTIVLRKEGELIQALQNTPYSIGAFSLSYAIAHKLPVNHLSLDGIAPTLKNIKANQYTMVRTIGLVCHKEASEATKRMVQHLTSPAAGQTIEAEGYVIAPSKS